MRVTTVFRRLIGVTQMYVEKTVFAIDGSLSVLVRPTWRLSRCGQCGRRAPRYDRKPLRRWRHLPWGRSTIDLMYPLWRVDCRRCGGVRVEKVPWAEHQSRFTYDFEEMTAYLSQITDRTQVSRLLRISWETVGSIVARVVERRLDPERLSGLRRIGIDEFSYRKYHHYLTVVVDHDRKRVIWAGKGRSAEALQPFFDLLGPERCKAIKTVTIDMSAAYKKAVEAGLPQAEVIFDRFHVQRLAGDALDEVRRELVRELAPSEEAKAVKGTRFVLLKNPWNLSRAQRRRLCEIQRDNQKLYRAYLLKESLARALDYRQPWRARKALRAWLAWAARSRLKPFVKVARTIRQHLEGVLAYIQTRLTNGLVEGLNGKIRMITRRAFGFHSHRALIAMVFLNCGGIRINAPLPTRS